MRKKVATNIRYLNCDGCKLKSKKIRVDYSGDPNSSLWIIGQCPGVEELKSGKPFIGRSGRLLWATARKLGEYSFSRDDVFVTNVLSCFHPAGADINEELANECFKKNLLPLIIKYKPKVLVLLGEVACKCFVLSSKIYDVRGYHFTRRLSHYLDVNDDYKFYIIPTFHPSFILRRTNDQPAHLRFFKSDLKIASYLSKQKFVDYTLFDDDIVILKEDKDISYFFENILFKSKIVAFDIETTSIKPQFGKIVSVSFCCDGKTYVMDVEDCFDKFKDYFVKFLTDHNITKVAHNLKYEAAWFYYYCNILVEEPFDDTMLLAFSLRPNIVDLKTLANIYLGVDDYSFNFKKLDVSDKRNRKTLLLYNARDSYYTYHLYLKLKELFDKKFKGKVWEYAYTKWWGKAPPLLAKVEVDGVFIDTQVLDELEQKFKSELVEIIQKIYTDKYVKQLSNFDQVVVFLDLVPGDSVYEKLMYIYTSPKKSDFRKLGNKIFRYVFNINSTQHLIKLLKEYYKVNLPKTEKGNYSVDNNVLSNLNLPICKYILEYRGILKKLSTYIVNIRDLLDKENRLHTDYIQIGTKTSRLSSREPNLQNWPKNKGLYLRRIFSAPTGKILVKADASSLEVRVLQMYAKDPILGRYLNGGGDMHYDAALDLYNDSELAKQNRSNAKNGIVFPVFYGAGFPTVRAAFPELSEKRVKEVYDKLKTRFKGIIDWQQKMWDFYCNYGFVQAMHGFRRYMPMNFNAVINSPIQGFAAFIVFSAWLELIKEGYDAPIEVHDEIVLVVDDNEESIVDAVRALYNKIIKRPFKILKEVPLDIEVKIGYNWGEMETIDYHKYIGE